MELPDKGTMIELRVDTGRITELALVHLDTVVAGGPTGAILIAPSDGEFHAVAQAARARVLDLTGEELPIASEATFEGAMGLDGHAIAVGHAGNNNLLRRLHYLGFLNDGDYPLEGLRAVSVHSPFGDGHNVLAALGYTPSASRASLESMLDEVVQGDGEWMVKGRLHKVEPRPQTGDLEAILEQGRDQQRRLDGRMGATLTCLGHLKSSGEERWARAFIEAITPYATGEIPLSFWLMSGVDFWTDRLVIDWDAVEEFPFFTDDERLLLANFVASCAEYCHDSITYQKWRILPEEHQIFNHHTFPATGLFFASTYLRRHGYEIADLDHWIDKSLQVFARAAEAGRSFDEGGAGYSWLVGNHLLRVQLALGDTSYARSEKLKRYADLAAVIQNNHFELVPFGDCGGYHATGTGAANILLRAAEWHDDPGCKWLAEKHAPAIAEADVLARDVASAPPEEHLGLFVLPLDAAVYRWSALPRFPNYPPPPYPPNVPVEACFDKLSMRAGWGPDDDYILLQGFGDGQHAHPDANGISQYQARGRLFLAESDYIRRWPKQHNMMMVIRDGEHGPIPVTARLDETLEFSGGAMTQTSLIDYNGCDWLRTILWLAGDCAVVVDTLTAKAAGEYELRCYWRTLGEAALTDRGLHTDQDGEHFHVIELSDSSRRMDIEGLPLNATKYPNYEFGDARPKTLCETWTARLEQGDEACFVNLLLPNGTSETPRRSIDWTEQGNVLVSGDGPMISLSASGFQVEGAGTHFFASDSQLTALKPRPEPALRRAAPASSRSVERAWHVQLSSRATCLADLNGGALVGCEDGSVARVAADGDLTIVDQLEGRVGAVLAGAFYGEQAMTLIATGHDETLRMYRADGGEHARVALPPNSHMPAWGTALCAADLDGDGKLWPVVGTAAWRVHPITQDGQLRWTFDSAAHSVTCLASGDLNGDGRDEITAGTVYFCVPAITPDGGRLWEDEDYNDYWTAGPVFPFVEIADVDGDGQLEVLTAGSDALVHCIDSVGEKKWARSIGDDPAGLVITARGVAAASLTGDLHLLDGFGERVWRAQLGSPCTALATTGEHLCVGLESGDLVWVALDGSEVARHHLDAPARYLMADAAGRVFAASEDGRLTLLAPVG